MFLHEMLSSIVHTCQILKCQFICGLFLDH